MAMFYNRTWQIFGQGHKTSQWGNFFASLILGEEGGKEDDNGQKRHFFFFSEEMYPNVISVDLLYIERLYESEIFKYAYRQFRYTNPTISTLQNYKDLDPKKVVN